MPRLDSLAPLQAHVGYGNLGMGGSLGYEGKPVSVQGVRYEHALSTHPPARLLYHLGGKASAFRCRVALNDDVPAGYSRADFVVAADGRQVALAAGVAAGEPPRDLAADVAGAHTLELLVSTSAWAMCHAVWLDPELDGAPIDAAPAMLVDCLGRAEIDRPPELPRAERCIATVASPGFEGLLDDMLGSLVANGGCPDARLVVLLLGTSTACERVVAKYRALPVACRPVDAINNGSKAILYSIARAVDAERYVCLDADTLVLSDLSPVFAALDAVPEGSILACREGNSEGYENLGHILWHAYGGVEGDIGRILGESRNEEAYALVVNDGIFAGSRAGMLALDGAIRSMPGARGWLEEAPHVTWRNQFLFNLALARMRCGVELDATYNVQLHTSEVTIEQTVGPVRLAWQRRPVRVLHINGWGRGKLPELKGLYAAVTDPLAGPGDGDVYPTFLAALRAWIGRHGVGSALAWSFYGTADGGSARIRDPSTLPVLALLHYLIRANGCVRVLETGTARGVSAACLASAVAYRPEGRVVSFDPCEFPEREELWNALPEAARACIEPRTTDSIEGMRAALAAGERYDAALLDSVHTEEHLGAEFDLATELVCPGGLILVHDSRWIPGIENVLRRAQEAGYGVARLLGAECGVTEDTGLGLAVVENRRAGGEPS